jgi:hypothetical protein
MNWVSLPASICVLSTLLLGPIGTVCILVAYLLLDFLRFKIVDLPYALLGAVAHSAGPYLVYLFADRVYGLQASLSNLTSKRLLLVIVVCSAICPAVQSLGMSAFGASWDIADPLPPNVCGQFSWRTRFNLFVEGYLRRAAVAVALITIKVCKVRRRNCKDLMRMTD